MSSDGDFVPERPLLTVGGRMSAHDVTLERAFEAEAVAAMTPHYAVWMHRR
jgi:hypothetical protein